MNDKMLSKFATKSDTGSGLYISKSIGEAHAGKIWAEINSSDCKGDSFTFSQPFLFRRRHIHI